MTLTKETNLEHYKERLKRILKEHYKDPRMIFYGIQKHIDPEIKVTCGVYTSNILDWMAQEYKQEILDKVEKKYLSDVIRPFRKEVLEILKLEDHESNQEYLVIQVGHDCVELPRFKKETMYKGMAYYRAYRPEDLGL